MKSVNINVSTGIESGQPWVFNELTEMTGSNIKKCIK